MSLKKQLYGFIKRARNSAAMSGLLTTVLLVSIYHIVLAQWRGELSRNSQCRPYFADQSALLCDKSVTQQWQTNLGLGLFGAPVAVWLVMIVFQIARCAARRGRVAPVEACYGLSNCSGLSAIWQKVERNAVANILLNSCSLMSLATLPLMVMAWLLSDSCVTKTFGDKRAVYPDCLALADKTFDLSALLTWFFTMMLVTAFALYQEVARQRPLTADLSEAESISDHEARTGESWPLISNYVT